MRTPQNWQLTGCLDGQFLLPPVLLVQDCGELFTTVRELKMLGVVAVESRVEVAVLSNVSQVTCVKEPVPPPPCKLELDHANTSVGTVPIYVQLVRYMLVTGSTAYTVVDLH